MSTEVVLTWALVTEMLAFVMPALAALIKRLNLSKTAQDMAILAFYIVVAGLAGILIGNIALDACADISLEACVAVVIGYIQLVMAQAFIWYKMFWQASGIEARIAGNKQ